MPGEPDGELDGRSGRPEARGEAGQAAAQPSESALFTLPNVITLARLCIVPVVVWLVIQHRLDIAFLLFVGAGVSDAVDGWLARVRNARSFLGSILDPMADKALLVSVYVTLAIIGVLPDWLAILVVFRDVLIVGGLMVLALMGARPAIRPLFVSKLNTAMQIALAAAALFLRGYGFDGGWLMPALIGCVAGTTIASGAAYVRDASRSLPA
ncbi:CDP-alcohol phosphatidyltransferase family protein [Muricoccus aerilatus]|uniref:CDP-alcohol phosphatidyltransferase family protein n=1 Tax=Muricoccus aerilatus TaxID=452982 RepID=UPI000A854E54|nr:CDP-alcohol phosphatidyltransferase family protein [Roseomonas aerilata]